MSIGELILLFAAGVVGGVINSVSSGGSFFTYPAMLFVGLTPIEASTTTLAALTPGNLAAVPEYGPEVRSNRHRYPRELSVVFVGGCVGIVLLFATGSDAFETVVPWLILVATLLFAVSPAIARWAHRSAPSITDGWAGASAVFVLSIYLTYFGSGIGSMMLAVFTIRGFGDFLSANAAKNIAMSLGTTMAAIAYTASGYIDWGAAAPVVVGSAISARYASRFARRVPVNVLRAAVVVFGLIVAGYQFSR